MGQCHLALTSVGSRSRWIILLATLLLAETIAVASTTDSSTATTPATTTTTVSDSDPTTAKATTSVTTHSTTLTETPTTETATGPITTASDTTSTKTTTSKSTKIPTTTTPATTVTTTLSTTTEKLIETTTSTLDAPTTVTLSTSAETTPTSHPISTTTEIGTSSGNPTVPPITDTTTGEMPHCEPGRFGPPDCEFKCACKNYTEACNILSGLCTSGCPVGHGGPGCNLLSALHVTGHTSVVVMLGMLLTMALMVAAGLFVTLLRIKKQQAYAASAENHAYEFPEMDSQYDVIEKIRETDIQVITDPLGEGRFGDILPGKVQRGKRRVDVAFKTLKDGSSELERSGFMAQLHMYNQLEPHPNIIQFFGLCTVADQLFAAFELASNGNLRNFLRRNGMPESESSSTMVVLSQTMLVNFCIEIAQGMHYLSSKKLVHRELMARHVLVTKDFTCKVAGLNSTVRNEQNLPVRWMAPESLLTGQFNHSTDVWSFGVVMWEVMSLGGQPYPDVLTKDLPNLLSGTYRMTAPETCDAQVYTVMRSCWEEEPEIRRPFGELITKLKYIMETGEERISIILEEDDELNGLDD